MFVKVVVVSLENKAKEKSSKKGNRIELSMRPALLNKSISSWEVGMQAYGAIKSVEEKGYIVDMGTGKNQAGFLAFKDAPKPVGANDRWK
jgi:hypothetical protein